MKKFLFVAVFLGLIIASSPVATAQTLTEAERQALLADLREQLVALMNQLIAKLQEDMAANTQKLSDIETKQAQQDEKINQLGAVSASEEDNTPQRPAGYKLRAYASHMEDPEDDDLFQMEDGKYIVVASISDFFEGDNVSIVAKDTSTGEVIKGELYQPDGCGKIANSNLRVCTRYMKYLTKPGQFIRVLATLGDQQAEAFAGRK